MELAYQADEAILSRLTSMKLSTALCSQSQKGLDETSLYEPRL
jgi:hypothetical protein